MKATLYLPGGETRVLEEQQLFALYVLRETFMGQSVLCADSRGAALVLGFASAWTLAQSGRFVAFAGEEACGGTCEPLASNFGAEQRLLDLGRSRYQACPRGPVLIIENEPEPLTQQVGECYSLLF